MVGKKLRLAILKEVSIGNSALSEGDFQVSEDEFGDAVRFLVREGYLVGVDFSDDLPQMESIGPVLTEKGEKHLEENSFLFKTYRGLKEARDWFKL